MQSPTDKSETSWLPWLAWAAGAVFFFYAWILRVSPSVIVDELMAELAVGGAIVGHLSALYFYGYSGMQLPVGLLIDRYGPRRLITAAAAICALGAAGFAGFGAACFFGASFFCTGAGLGAGAGFGALAAGLGFGLGFAARLASRVGFGFDSGAGWPLTLNAESGASR